MRDIGLLESSLARPQQLHTDGDNPGIIDMAAAYAVGFVRDDPFVDGNKRTGFVVGVLFVEMNGYRFTTTEPAATLGVLSLTAGSPEETAFPPRIRAKVKRQ